MIILLRYLILLPVFLLSFSRWGGGGGWDHYAVEFYPDILYTCRGKPKQGLFFQ